MQLITEWTSLDIKVASVLVKMLGSSVVSGAAIYGALATSGPKRDAMRALARTALRPDQAEVLEAIMGKYARVEAERNRIVHWIWGYTDDLPEAVLLCPPKEFMALQVRIAIATGDSESTGVPREKVLVYSRSDFLQTRERIATVGNWLDRFTVAIAGPDWPAGSAKTSLTPELILERLKANPELAERLERLKQRRSKPAK